jgi:TonB family protein
VITQPDWIAKPTDEALAHHYPELATVLSLSVDALLGYTVSAEGSLTNCRAESKRPAGLGFGQAAMAITGEFKMKPMTINGQPVDGGIIHIPIRFMMSSAESVTPAPPPISEEAAKHAQRVVDISKAVDQVLDGYDAIANRLETMAGDPTLGRAAAEAYRHATQALRQDIRDA